MKYKDGSVNTDDQIVGLLIALLFAGQHTSSITSTWTTLLTTRLVPSYGSWISAECAACCLERCCVQSSRLLLTLLKV